MRYFLAVAEELHFGRAARRLHIAQPPLSQQIRKLEEELGVQLFARTKRSVALTHAGRALLGEARQTLLRAEHAAEVARRAGRGEIGPLRVVCAPLAGATVLPLVLPLFRVRFPAVELRIHECSLSEVVAALDDGNADAGLLVSYFELDTLRKEMIMTVPMGAALPRKHPLAGRRRIHLRQLAHERFILFTRGPGTGFYHHILGLCRRAGFTPDVVQEVLHTSTLVTLVAAGYGVSLFPMSLAPIIEMQEVSLVRLADAGANIGLCAAWRAADESPVLAAFLEVARAACRAAAVKRR